MSAQPLEIRMAHLEGAYEQISHRLGNIEQRLGSMELKFEGRLGQVDGRFAQIDARFGRAVVCARARRSGDSGEPRGGAHTGCLWLAALARDRRRSKKRQQRIVRVRRAPRVRTRRRPVRFA